MMLEWAGDIDGAERLARQAVAAGDANALEIVTRMRRMAGDHDGAARIARFGLTAGGIEDPWSE
jgi:hypothetical protein